MHGAYDTMNIVLAHASLLTTLQDLNQEPCLDKASSQSKEQHNYLYATQGQGGANMLQHLEKPQLMEASLALGLGQGVSNPPACCCACAANVEHGVRYTFKFFFQFQA